MKKLSMKVGEFIQYLNSEDTCLFVPGDVNTVTAQVLEKVYSDKERVISIQIIENNALFGGAKTLNIFGDHYCIERPINDFSVQGYLTMGIPRPNRIIFNYWSEVPACFDN